jgi:hypothetical protein
MCLSVETSGLNQTYFENRNFVAGDPKTSPPSIDGEWFWRALLMSAEAGKIWLARERPWT